MAVPRRVLALILGGTLLFGALLFLLGLLVGSSLSTNNPVRPAPLPPVTLPPAPQPTVPVVPPVVPVPGGASGGPAPVPAPAPPAGAPPAPAKSGDVAPAAPAPPVKPVKVKGFGYGAPPSSRPASGLRGRLLEQAGVAPPDAATDPAAKPPTPPAAPPAATEPPAEPLVFSVAVGRFLLEDNAARRLAEAQAKGFQPVLVVSDPPDPAGWLTVTLGPRGDAVQAGRLAEDASAQGFETALVSWLAP